MRLRLAAGERVIARTRPQPRALLWPFLAALVLLAVAGFVAGWLNRNSASVAMMEWMPLMIAAAAAVGILLMLRMFVLPLCRWAGTRYILTSRRLIRRKGFTRRSEHEIALANMYQLDITQTLLQRSTGSGTLTVDMGRDRMVSYPDMPQIYTFKDFVMSAIGELPMTVMFDGVDMEVDSEEVQWGGNGG